MGEGCQVAVTAGNSQVHSRSWRRDFADHGSRILQGTEKTRNGEGLGKIQHGMMERVWKKEQEQEQGMRNKNGGENLLTIDRNVTE